MSTDSLDDLLVLAVIAISLWCGAVLALVAFLLRRLFNVPVSLTVGTVLAIGSSVLWFSWLLWFRWPHEGFAWLLVAVTLGGALLICWAGLQISRWHADAVGQPMIHRRSLHRPERYRVAAALAALSGFLVVPLQLVLSVLPPELVLPLTLFGWLLGVALWIVALITAARDRRDTHRTYRSYDELGRYVEGMWVCFEHERRWCRVCSKRASRPGGPDASSSAKTGLDGFTRA